MLDVAVLAEAVLVGALTAAVIMRLIAWMSRRTAREGAHWSWAIGLGVLAAGGATDQWPQWPALEDRARFLTLIVPLTLMVEALAAAMGPVRLAWFMRLGMAATVAPILLHNSVYLAVLDGRNSAEWSPFHAAMILCALAALLALTWAALSALESRTSTPTVYWVLILDAFAAAVTVMRSGYYMGGLLGLGLAGAMTGAALSEHVAQPQATTRGSLGMSVIGIFAVVLMGRFFGTLSTGLAACLLFAPLLAWTVELPRLRAMARGWRGAWRLACVAVPLIVAVVIAQRKFVAASAAHPPRSKPTVMRDLRE